MNWGNSSWGNSADCKGSKQTQSLEEKQDKVTGTRLMKWSVNKAMMWCLHE